MIETTVITYGGAQIEIPEFLKDYWPLDQPLEEWPSFCGAGEGLGDKIVPEHICGVCVSPL